jgi:hypothetical protein
MPMRKPKPSANEREVVRKPRKPQARKSADRPLRRAAPWSPGLLPERQTRHRDRRALLSKEHPGEYVARKFVITEDFYGPTYESISSRSLRDVRNVLRSLYRSLIQLKRLPDDGPDIVEVWL